MRVTYYSAQGAVRMVYLNVSTARYCGKYLVELQKVTRWQDTEQGKEVNKSETLPNYFRGMDTYSTLAIINLAPGEYLEWSNDAERS
jgi:hypothetical protein